MRNEPGKPVNKPSVPQERPAFTLKKEVKTLSEPTGKLNSTNISISQLIDKNQKKTSSDPTKQVVTPFDRDDLIPLWKQSAHQARIDGKEAVFHAMLKREPQRLDEVTYLFEVDHVMQKSRLETSLEEIQTFLRKELKNDLVTIQIEISESVEEHVGPLTALDQFEKLARKNQNLRAFVDKFQLDIKH